MNRATVDSTITFTGDSPDSRLFRLLSSKWLSRPTSMKIIQPKKEGLYWKIGEKGKENPISIHYVYGHKSPITGARQIILSNQEDRLLNNVLPKKGEKAYVMEHILSALNYVGITDATIQLDPAQFSKTLGYAPIVGSGITKLVTQLQKHKQELSSKTKYITINNTFEDTIIDKRGTHYLSGEPSNNLEIKIEGSDLGNITVHSKYIHLKDTYKELDITARPVARLDSKLKLKGLKWLNKRGFKGVSPETYIMGTFDCSEEEFVQKMNPQFQKTANEQVWHGAIDRTGELYAIAGLPIKGKFTFKKANHITAIASLKKMYKENAFSITQ